MCYRMGTAGHGTGLAYVSTSILTLPSGRAYALGWVVQMCAGATGELQEASQRHAKTMITIMVSFMAHPLLGLRVYRVKITRTPPPALSMDLIRFLAGFLLNSDRVITIVYFAIGLVLAGDQHKRDVLNRSIDVVTDFVILGDYDFGRCLVCHAL